MDTNNHKGHRKRMREDFEKGGFKTWQKHKVLEYLLYNVIPVADTNDIAHNLIKECGGFVNVFHTSKKTSYEHRRCRGKNCRLHMFSR